MNRIGGALLVIVLHCGCADERDQTQVAPPSTVTRRAVQEKPISLNEARESFSTNLIRNGSAGQPLPEPLKGRLDMQIVELHYRHPPSCDYAAVKARAEEILGSDLDSSDPAEADKAFLIFHKQHPVKYQDGQAPAQTAILAADQPMRIDAYQQEIEQSRSCRGADDLIRGCTATRLVMEMMARPLPPQERILLFHGVLQAMVAVTAPDALVFKHSQQIVKPADYMDACGDAAILRPGSLNVRFFNISNSDGDMVMDTRGLEEIGLHDLQCHFRDLDPNGVSRVLYNTAVYIFENGPVIESGQTVAGIEPDSKWRCQFEDALLEPKREILDLNPGEPYAAGNR